MSGRREQLESQLSAYLDGELTAEERAEVDALLADDAGARAVLDELRATVEAVGALPRAKARPELAEALRSRMERRALLGEREPASRRASSAGVWGGRWVAAAAVIGLAFVAGYFIWPAGDEGTKHAGEKFALDTREQEPAAPHAEAPAIREEVESDLAASATAGSQADEKAAEHTIDEFVQAPPPAAPPGTAGRLTVNRETETLGDKLGLEQRVATPASEDTALNAAVPAPTDEHAEALILNGVATAAPAESEFSREVAGNALAAVPREGDAERLPAFESEAGGGPPSTVMDGDRADVVIEIAYRDAASRDEAIALLASPRDAIEPTDDVSEGAAPHYAGEGLGKVMLDVEDQTGDERGQVPEGKASPEPGGVRETPLGGTVASGVDLPATASVEEGRGRAGSRPASAPAVPPVAEYTVVVADRDELDRLVERLRSAEHPPAEVRRIQEDRPTRDDWFYLDDSMGVPAQRMRADADRNAWGDKRLAGDASTNFADAATQPARVEPYFGRERASGVSDRPSDELYALHEEAKFGEGESAEQDGRSATEPAAAPPTPESRQGRFAGRKSSGEALARQSTDVALQTADLPATVPADRGVYRRAEVAAAAKSSTEGAFQPNRPAALVPATTSAPADEAAARAYDEDFAFGTEFADIATQPASNSLLLLHVYFEPASTQPASVDAPAAGATQPAAETQPAGAATQPAPAAP